MTQILFWLWRQRYLAVLILLGVGAWLWGNNYPTKKPAEAVAQVPLPAAAVVAGVELLAPRMQVALTMMDATTTDNVTTYTPGTSYNVTIHELSRDGENAVKTIVLNVGDDEQASELRALVGDPGNRFVFSIPAPTPTPAPSATPIATQAPATSAPTTGSATVALTAAP